MTYNFIFILLNLSLYFGYAAESVYFDGRLKELALGIQEITIYLLISICLLLFLLDFVPLAWLKKGTFV